MTTYQFIELDNHEAWRQAFPVMSELRPHLHDEAAFITQLLRQQQQGYRLLAAREGERVVGLAGYRIQENFIYGRFLYVDDLVVTRHLRSQGCGQQLIQQLRDKARAQHCACLVLDTGLGNALGQRFYFRQGLLAKGMHFCQVLAEQ